MRFQQPFPILSDEYSDVFSTYGAMYILLDETMTVRHKTTIIDDDVLRQHLENAFLSRVTIDHQPLPNTEDTDNDYHLNCTIASESPLVSDSVKIFWSIDNGTTFTESLLTPDQDSSFVGMIPAQPVGTTVSYYLRAEAENNQWAADPWTGPENLHTFQILVDQSMPVITHEAIDKWPVDKWSPPISAQVIDELEVTVYLEYEIDGGASHTIPMLETGHDTWSAELPPVSDPGLTITYRIAAMDAASTPNYAIFPQSGSCQISVVDSLDVAVIDLDLNQNSGPSLRDGLKALGLSVDYFDQFPTHLNIFDTLFICAGTQPNTVSIDPADAEKAFFYLNQGGNAYLEGGNIWCDNHSSMFHKMFAIRCTDSGQADTSSIVGYPNTFATGLELNYNGENASMDRLEWGHTDGECTQILRNLDPDYCNTISNFTSDYRTIGSSFEFGGLTGSSTCLTSAVDLLEKYADYFGLIDLPTPTPRPTHTPTATPTPLPTCDYLGATITMSDTQFSPGDLCDCSVELCNPTTQAYSDIPLFAFIECYGAYFFWPSFSEFDYESIYLFPGKSTKLILPQFTWPQATGSGEATWYAGMTNPEQTAVFGEISRWSFCWNDE